MIGIDLGTTYSAMAVTDGTALPVIIRNREGENITPSVVMIQGGTAVVGSQAKRSAVTAPEYVVQFVKRDMGEQAAVFTDENGKEYRPEEISAMILRRLKEDAEMQLGGPVDSAVITVPAYFDDARRVATRDAGRIAGLEVLRVINEPTAAVLAYGSEHPQGGNLGTVLVYDLGGGTFDVTVMQVGGGEFKVLATDGDRDLGGFDWDNALMTELNEQFVARGGPDLTDDDALLADLRDKAELAKRSLTLMPQTVVMLTAGGRTEQIKITRTDFEKLTQPLLRATEQITEKVLTEAKLAWSELDEVLLVGGSTRMPMVPALVERLWGRAARGGVNQDEAVALGAALMAYDEKARAAVRDPDQPEESDTTGSALSSLTRGKVLRVSDVTSQSLGILVEDPPGTRSLVNVTMIPHNSTLPARHTNTFSTAVANQSMVRVQVTEGDDPEPEFVRVIGVGTLSIPLYPANAPLEITYSYDLDAIIHVEVRDLTSGEPLGEFDIERSANLGEDQLASMSMGLRATGIG